MDPTVQDKSAGTELFKVLKVRHACRDFDVTPIPDDILQKLAFAAHRASTGGNVPYRFIVIVNDPIQLKMLRLVSPGYLSHSPAAIVVCTDLKIAEQGLGKLGPDKCSMYDAGAAAENIVLAAYALGLGGSFIKSYPEAAVRKILDLPEGIRTELIISLGYPAQNEAKPLKKQKGDKITYLNRYGHLWSSMRDNGISPVQAHPSGDQTTPEQYIFELVIFLLTSARSTLDEPCTYGSSYLLDAVKKLTDLYSKMEWLKPDDFLITMKRSIEESQTKVMVSEVEFVKFIDDLVDKFTDELMNRYGTRTQTQRTANG